MSDWHTGGYASREGLSSRNHLFGGSDHLQLNVEGEFDFDQEIEGLRSQVGRLKEVTKAVHAEAQEQSKLAESLQDALEKGQYALKQARKRLNTVFKKAKSNHLTYLALFAFLIIMCVWFLAKLVRMSRMITG